MSNKIPLDKKNILVQSVLETWYSVMFEVRPNWAMHGQLFHFWTKLKSSKLIDDQPWY